MSSSPTRNTFSRAPRSDSGRFRYFTFEPEIHIDKAILVDYLERAADLAVLPSSVRRTLDEAVSSGD